MNYGSKRRSEYLIKRAGCTSLKSWRGWCSERNKDKLRLEQENYSAPEADPVFKVQIRTRY